MGKRIFCKICNKPIRSESGYCRKHSDKIGKYVRTLRHKRAMQQKMKGRKVPWMKGKKRPKHSSYLKKWWKEHPEERKKAKARGKLLAQDKKYLQKLSELLSGEKNPNWRGGLAQKQYKGFYKKLKEEIRKRDNYTCQLCGKTEKELEYTLSINHIDFNKKNSIPSNLNALCKRCNSLINFDRAKWTKYFSQKLAIRGITNIKK